MKRIHFFEFEDLSWFPSIIRNYGTDYLRFIATQFDIFKGVIPVLRKALRRSEHHQVLDLASGGGGGWIRLYEHLREDFPEIKVTLTDFYPNQAAFNEIAARTGPNVTYFDHPVDCRAVPKDLKGLRTQLLSFHHFRPEDALKILQNAVDAKQPIVVLEVTERKVISLLPILLSPLTVLAFTPFIRPFKFGRILFTYIIPVVLPFVLWDGIVSVLRSYTVPELKEMASKVKGQENYEWEIDRKQDGPAAVIYLAGWPKDAVSTKGIGEQ
jgi:hypothetical protein